MADNTTTWDQKRMNGNIQVLVVTFSSANTQKDHLNWGWNLHLEHQLFSHLLLTYILVRSSQEVSSPPSSPGNCTLMQALLRPNDQQLRIACPPRIRGEKESLDSPSKVQEVSQSSSANRRKVCCTFSLHAESCALRGSTTLQRL